MIIERLKQHNPSRLEVRLGDDSIQKVSIAKSGKKWDRAAKLLDGVDWVEVRMYDPKDNLVGTLEREADEDDDGDVDIDGGEVDEGTGMSPSKTAAVMLAVMKGTMAEVRRMFEVQMKAQADCMAQLTDANRLVIDSYKHAMELQRAWLTAPDKEDGGGGNMGEVMQMMQMASLFLAQKRQTPPGIPAAGGAQ